MICINCGVETSEPNVCPRCGTTFQNMTLCSAMTVPNVDPMDKIIIEAGRKNLRVYCPACGTWNDATEDMNFGSISPGVYQWHCKDCGTNFEIRVEFHEIE